MSDVRLLSPQVTVILPVYKNGPTLDELNRRLHRSLEGAGFDHELIFVDDCCPHGSLVLLRRLAMQDARNTVLGLRENVGQHTAIMLGLVYSRSPWTVVLDADLQDPPEVIPQLLVSAEPHTDAIFAGRRGAYESAFRLLTSRLFKTLLHWMTGIPQDAGVFVALNQDSVRRLLALRTRRAFLPAMIGCLNLQMQSVPVERSQRPVGHSAYSSLTRLRSAWRAFGCVWDCCYRRRTLPPPVWGQPERVIRVCYGARFAAD